jgi:hypothetical protein
MNSEDHASDSAQREAHCHEHAQDESVVELLFQDDELPDAEDLIRAVSLGQNRYQLLETPVWSEDYTIGDVVAASRRADGTLVLGRILDPSGLRAWRWWFVPRVIHESKQFAAFLADVAGARGKYQVDTGGFEQRIEVSLPPESTLDPDAAMNSLFESAQLGALEPACTPLLGRPRTQMIDLNKYR